MLNCKICENPGISIFSFSYNSPELTSFLENYYQSHCKEIQTLLKDKSYNILMCKSCQFMWQKFIPSENFLKLLYEKFIDKKSSFQKYLDNKNKFKNSFTYQIKNLSGNYESNEKYVHAYASCGGGSRNSLDGSVYAWSSRN